MTDRQTDDACTTKAIPPSNGLNVHGTVASSDEKVKPVHQKPVSVCLASC